MDLIDVSEPLYQWHNLEQLMRIEKLINLLAVVVWVVQNQKQNIANELTKIIQVAIEINVLFHN